MNLNRGKITPFLGIAVPVVIIFLLFMMIFQTDKHVKHTRDYYVHTFVDIIKISIEKSDNQEQLGETSMDIIHYLNMNNDRIVLLYIYTDDLKSIIPSQEIQVDIPFDFNGEDSDIKELIMSQEEGMITKKINNDKRDVYFQWVYSESLNKDLLVIYTITDKILAVPYIYTYAIIIIILIFAHVLISNLIDRGIYMEVLRKSQKDSINTLSSYKK